MTTLVDIRDAKDDERGIAYSAWWNQCVDTRSKHYRGYLTQWRHWCQGNVMQVLEECQVLVATPSGDSEDVVGVVCYQAGVVHFVYVKFHVRRWGIARKLLDAAIQGWDDVRFTTMPRRRLRGLIGPGWNFDLQAGTGI